MPDTITPVGLSAQSSSDANAAHQTIVVNEIQGDILIGLPKKF